MTQSPSVESSVDPSSQEIDRALDELKNVLKERGFPTNSSPTDWA
jgi:hypothetical protein